MSVKSRKNNGRENDDTAAPSPPHEVEAFEASNGADMPMFANIPPKPMMASTAAANSFSPSRPAKVGNSGRKSAGARGRARQRCQRKAVTP